MKPWVFSISLFPGALGLRAHRRQSGRVLLGEDSLAAPAAGAVHRALSERAGGDRPRGAQASRRVDRRRRRPTPRTSTARWPASPASSCRCAPADRTHVYYQYCVIGPEGPQRDELVVRCVRRGIDIETLHVDVPPDMELFGTVHGGGERRAPRRAGDADSGALRPAARSDRARRPRGARRAGTRLSASLPDHRPVRHPRGRDLLQQGVRGRDDRQAELGRRLVRRRHRRLVRRPDLVLPAARSHPLARSLSEAGASIATASSRTCTRTRR